MKFAKICPIRWPRFMCHRVTLGCPIRAAAMYRPLPVVGQVLVFKARARGAQEFQFDFVIFISQQIDP